MAGVREAYVATLDVLRRRDLPVYDVSSRVRLTKSPAEYMAVRETRRELPYEAMLASGRTHWSVGDRVRVYRTRSGSGGVIEESEDEAVAPQGVERAFAPEDYEALFADPDQMSLFAPRIDEMRARLTTCQ